MREQLKAVVVVFSLAAATGCGHSEKGVVDQYFGALRQGDTQTLNAFAATTFTEKVERWDLKGDLGENRGPIPLPDLVKAQQAAEKELADNKRQATLYQTEHFADVEVVRDALKKGAPMPPKVSAVAADWAKFGETDRSIKKRIAEAKDAVEKEKRVMAKSVGSADNLDSLTGEVIDKKLQLALTIGGQPKDYVMALRKYAVKDGTRNVPGRWVVWSIKPGNS